GARLLSFLTASRERGSLGRGHVIERMDLDLYLGPLLRKQGVDLIDGGIFDQPTIRVFDALGLDFFTEAVVFEYAPLVMLPGNLSAIGKLNSPDAGDRHIPARFAEPTATCHFVFQAPKVTVAISATAHRFEF